MPYNKPAVLIFLGCFCALFAGACMPVTGIILSKLLGYMTAAFEMLDFMAIMDADFTGTGGREYLKSNVNFFSAMMGLIAFGAGVTGYFKGISFGNLGANVTESIRKILYESILRKNIGWFDDRENGVSVLTSAMAQDTSVINGVSSESLAPQLEGGIAFLVGIIIAFVACWQESLVCLAVSPVMIIGNALGLKF